MSFVESFWNFVESTVVSLLCSVQDFNAIGQLSSALCSNGIWWHLSLSFERISHYNDVIMGTIASQITSLTIVYSIVYSDADQRKHQSSASLAFVRGIHRGPVISPYKWQVTRKMFPFDDVIMLYDVPWILTCSITVTLDSHSQKGPVSITWIEPKWRPCRSVGAHPSAPTLCPNHNVFFSPLVTNLA